MRRICIIGSGYVGLVSGACFAEMGNRVACVDTDAARVESLREGRAPFFEPGLQEMLGRNASAGKLTYTAEYAEAVPDADFIFLCLPTPPSPNGAADISILRSAVETLAPLLARRETVVVNKSTAPVGATVGLQKLLERAGKRTPVVSNPEFLREGSAISDFMHPDRVVIGGADADAAARVRALYEPLGAPVLLTDPRTSEMVKYASNAFLATKISFINEIADICERVDADVSLVAEGMGLDARIGKAFLRPGVGYGGSCFPKDILALAHTAAMAGAHPRLMRAVMEVNSHQFKRVLHRLRDQLGTLDGATVAVWGLAFKPDTDDVREAPAIEIVQLLEQEGARVRAYDPMAMEKAAPRLPGVRMCRDAYEAAEGADAVLLLTGWREFKTLDLERVADSMSTPLLVDGRNELDPAKAEQAGLAYVGVGRPAAPAHRRLSLRVAGG